jgi:hypothetical protein
VDGASGQPDQVGGEQEVAVVIKGGAERRWRMASAPIVEIFFGVPEMNIHLWSLHFETNTLKLAN